MMVSNRNLIFQGSIFRFQPFVLGGVMLHSHEFPGKNIRFGHQTGEIYTPKNPET